jgi:hypothetical protein
MSKGNRQPVSGVPPKGVEADIAPSFSSIAALEDAAPYTHLADASDWRVEFGHS